MTKGEGIAGMFNETFADCLHNWDAVLKLRQGDVRAGVSWAVFGGVHAPSSRVYDVQEFHARDNVLLDARVDLARRIERLLGAVVGDELGLYG